MNSGESVFIIVLCFVAFLMYYMGNDLYQSNKEMGIKIDKAQAEFYKKCLPEHKDYECDAMWASAKRLIY